MSDFTILSDDEALAERICAGLAADDAVRRIGGGTDVRVPRPRPGEPDLIVLDLRSIGPEQAIGRLIEFRTRFTADRRVIAIVAGNATGAAVVASTYDADVDFVLDERVDIGIVIRAIANDKSGTGCSAIALLALERIQLPGAHAVAGVVLGSGCTVRSVLRVAQLLGVSESGLRNRLVREGSPPPLDAIRFASCVYALALARRMRGTANRLRGLVGIKGADAFREWCTEMLGGPVPELAKQWPQLSLQAFLARALAERPASAANPGNSPGGTPHRLLTMGEG